MLQSLVVAAANEVVEIWPENWPAWELFRRLGTQWAVGMGGRTGLRYEALYPLLDRLTDGPEQWNALFEDVRVIESAALEAMQDE